MNQQIVPFLLTPQEASVYLGVSVQTLAIWRCNKRYNLKYVKVGRNVRYNVDDLKSFLNARTYTGGEDSEWI